MDLVGAHVVDSQRVALVTLVKEGIARYTGYCQVLPGIAKFAARSTVTARYIGAGGYSRFSLVKRCTALHQWGKGTAIYIL